MTGVVVTGMGCVSGLGPDVVSTWRELVAGKTAIQHVKRTVEGHPDFCFEGAVAPICGDALRKLETHFGVRALAGVDVSANYAAAATLEALGDAGLLARQDILQCAAIIYGCATGGQSAIEAGYVRMFLDEETNVHPLSIPRFMLNAAVSHISMLFGARGHSVVVSSACSSSAHAPKASRASANCAAM